MSTDNTHSSVAISIMGREYRVLCNEQEAESLHRVIEYLNQEIEHTRIEGKVMGAERVAVMTALNLAQRLLACEEEKEQHNAHTNAVLQRLHERLDKSCELWSNQQKQQNE